MANQYYRPHALVTMLLISVCFLMSCKEHKPAPMISAGQVQENIAAMDRLKLQGRNVIAYKPTMDARYSLSQISTHSGAKWPAHCVSSGEMLWNHYSSHSGHIDAVAIDEAFMIDGVTPTVLQIMRMGTTVLVASLDLSARCKPFRETTTNSRNPSRCGSTNCCRGFEWTWP